ncbi:MAG: M6 family metalloprotease domain-containing protein [Candidatus Marinimicrobia bacterium]|nr:M6 family metalloprotease domain-containing protein [Candidatus Neomarinimicrobiota bacterium]
MIKFILINILTLSTIMASSPAMPGVNPSAKVKQQTVIMAESYTEGGLVAKMQRVKAANIQHAQNGSRDLREDVYMSFPVIMGSYSDRNDQDTVVSLLQQELFDGPWPTITMAEHYEQMSYGQFHLSGTVYGWYELGGPANFYEGSDNGFSSPPGGVGDFLRESLDLADLEVDFSQYDNDGPDGEPNSGDDDGYVDAAFFVHSGPGGEGGGPGIWSHRWTYSGSWGSAYMTNDTSANGQMIRVNDYIIQPAVSAGGSNDMIEIGVFSHEFGHALGLPDLYDTDYSSDGVGSWCLMASGSWSTPSSPVHMSAWCKEMLGWIVPVFPDQNTEAFEFPNAEENPYAVKLWTYGELEPYFGNYSHGQDVGQEYFLVENRQRIGSEMHLPGTGLVIWHIDNSRSTNSNENHRMVDVKAADNHFNGSNSGDSWPGSTNNRNFDFETLPSSVGWAGVNTEVALLNVSDSDTTMWADVEVHESNPHVAIIDMLVSDANGDNIFAPGENVLIWLIVENSGAEANNTTATLSTEGNSVEMVNAVVSFNPIPFMETSTSIGAFEFNISDTLSPGSVSFDVTFVSDEGPEPNHQQFSLLLGLPQLAVIDDDGAMTGSLDYLHYYSDALEAIERVHVVWDVAEQGLPDLDWLSTYPATIWFSGDNQAPLNENSITLISDYLDGGGNLLLTGQNVATGDASAASFLGGYFALELNESNIITPNVYGDPNHDFFDINDRFAIASDEGAQNQYASDSYTILEGGASIFMYPFLGGASAGVSVKNQTYSAVVLGFGLEALTQFGDEAENARGELINRLIVWLNTAATSINEIPLLLPETYGISSVYPNPFNPQVNIDIQLHEGLWGELQIIDLRGAVLESHTINQSGVVEWQPGNRIAGGVYFIRFMENGEISGQLEKITYLK